MPVSWNVIVPQKSRARIRVPDPDIAAILHHASVRGGLHPHSLICSGRRFDGFLAFDLHGDRNCFARVKNGSLKALPRLQWLRCDVENRREQVRDARRNRRLLVLADPGNEVLFIEDRFALRVIELQVAVHLAAAFNQLLAEPVRATCAPIER
jgi:hypothetical protein